MKHWVLPALVVLASALAVLPAAGQQTATVSPGGVMVQPRVGWVVSLGTLGRVADMPAAGGATALAATRSVSLGSGPAIGTAALFDVPGLPVLWRVDLDHAPSLAVELSGVTAPFDAAATFATAGVVTRDGGGRVSPFGQIGVGFRALRFRASEEDGLVIPDGRVDLLGRLGGGLAVRFGPVAVTGELSALTSAFRFDDVDDGAADRAFHLDLAGLVGVRLRVF